ncbi:MAG: hypothetical protein COA79_21195 [Planctomycetota bacterium]|nr:MAG: hypothetical protein COA79_21195 [Planctomycetota bacterium]
MNHSILIVDDDKNCLEFLKDSLKTNNHSVISSSSALDALEIMEEQAFDLIIIDVNMPEMNGVELAQKIFELQPDIKTLGITGGGFLGDADHVKSIAESFFTSFLKKPFDIEVLLNITKELLDKDYPLQ